VKRIATALALMMALFAAAPAYADMPYFGATPKDGNWWNSPSHDYNQHRSYAKVATQRALHHHRSVRG
jgi:Spy/CpxP family protein refolding chaperone